METMLNDKYSSNKIDSLAKKIKHIPVSNETFSQMYNKIKSDITQIAKQSTKDIADLEKSSAAFCEKRIHDCDAKFNYIYQIHRTRELHNVFAQTALYFEISKQSDLVVGINFVGAEDNKTAMKDYDTHMAIVGFLHEIYRDVVDITLHAGELSLALGDITINDMKSHVGEAVYTANAQRIGHGVDIPYEIDGEWPDLYQDMNTIAIEVPLTSNKVILEVEGAAHPITKFVNNGIPVVLATDDPGILNTDMTNEYVFAATTYDFSYQDFKKFNRNTLQFSFLPGTSLWIDSTYTKQLPQCSSGITHNCWVEGKDLKATAQNVLEEKLKIFESSMP